MQIIHWGRARKFIKEHPHADRALKQWRKVVQEADWTNFADVRQAFTTADWVEGRIVFNIKGNDYRLIAIVVFSADKLYIRNVLTHRDYDRGDWKK